MDTTTAPPLPPPSAEAPDAGAVMPLDLASRQLADAMADLADMERRICDAVLKLASILDTGVCETVEGLPLDHFLRLQARLIGSDAATLLTTAEVISSMPITAGLWADGQLTWGQVRNIAGTLKRRPQGERLVVDRRIGGTVERWDGLDGFHPDEILHVVDTAVQELRDKHSVERSEERAEGRSRFVRQPTFDGGMTFWGEADPVRAAILNTALDRKLAELRQGITPDADLEPGDGEERLAGSEPAKWGPTGIDALCAVAAEWQGGGTRPAKPLFLVHVDARHVSPNAAGLLDTALPDRLPTLSATLLELIAQDAHIQAVLFDGARPLATSKKLNASGIPRDVRTAIRARDRADRFPGSLLPASRGQVHHLRERGRGGDHSVDNLVLLADSSHNRLVHRRGWRTTLAPDTAVLTVQRDGRTYRSLPRGTPLEPDPGDPRRGPP